MINVMREVLGDTIGKRIRRRIQNTNMEVRSHQKFGSRCLKSQKEARHIPLNQTITVLEATHHLQNRQMQSMLVLETKTNQLTTPILHQLFRIHSTLSICHITITLNRIRTLGRLPEISCITVICLFRLARVQIFIIKTIIQSRYHLTLR